MKSKEKNQQVALIIHIFITAFLLFSTAYSQAQNIIKSYPDKVSSRFSDYEIIGKNDIGLVVHYFGTNESELVTYDDKMRIANRKELPFKGRAAVLENLILLKDKILVFYSTNSESHQYFKLKILDEKLIIPNETVVLDSIPLVNIGKGKAFYVKTSPDKSKILAFNMVKSKTSYFVRFTILSDSIRILNRNVFSAINPDLASLKSIKINNDGNVIAVVGEENGGDDYNIFKYTSFSFNRTSNTIGEQAVQYQDYVYKNLITEVSNKTGLGYLSLCYRHTKNKSDVGILYQIIDLKTNKLLLNTRMPFNEELLLKAQSNEFKTWQDKAMMIKPKRIIPRSDSGFVLITEAEYKTTRTERITDNNFGYYNSTPYTPAVRYVDQNHFYDISVFSINPDGNLDWQTNMPKSQVSENDEGYYSSFAFFEANNVLKFLYNEDFYNIGNFVEYNVNPNGLTKRQSIMNSEKQSLVMVPLKAKQLDGHTVVIPSEQKRTLQFVLFQY